MSEEDKIILIRITVPVIVYIVILICVELKIFRMAVTLILTFISAVIALILERTGRRYQEARKEIE
jgi:hypothetical protein